MALDEISKFHAQRLLCEFTDEEIERLNNQLEAVEAMRVGIDVTWKEYKHLKTVLHRKLKAVIEQENRCNLTDDEVNQLERLYRALIVAASYSPHKVVKYKEWTDASGRKYRKPELDEHGNPIKVNSSPLREEPRGDRTSLVSFGSDGRWHVISTEEAIIPGDKLSLLPTQIATDIDKKTLKRLVNCLPPLKEYFNPNSERDITARKLMASLTEQFVREYETKFFEKKGFYPQIVEFIAGKVKTRRATPHDFITTLEKPYVEEVIPGDTLTEATLDEIRRDEKLKEAHAKSAESRKRYERIERIRQQSKTKEWKEKKRQEWGKPKGGVLKRVSWVPPSKRKKPKGNEEEK